MRSQIADRQLDVIQIDFFLVDPITIAHFGFGHMDGVKDDAVKTLHSQLVALVGFELRGQNLIGLKNLQIALFTETAAHLKFRRLGNIHGEIVVGRRESEIVSLLQDELFLNQFLEQIAFEVQAFDHLWCERALENLAIALDGAFIGQGKFALADRLAVDFGHFDVHLIMLLAGTVEHDKA